MAEIDETQRTIGRLEGELQAMQRELSSMRASMSEQTKMLQSVVSQIERTKGGWSVLVGASTAGGTIAVAAYKLWHAIVGGGG